MGRPAQLKGVGSSVPRKQKTKDKTPSKPVKPVETTDPNFYKRGESVDPRTADDPSRALVLKRKLIMRALAEKSFHEYVKQAWHTIETVAFKDGRHIRVMCDILQQISEGRLGDAVINLPPRHMKSLLVSVFWPTWEWVSRPQEKFLCVSYDKALAEELGTKARKVIQSEWYQENWGHVYQLSQDQNAKHSYTNDKNGSRISIQMGGNITGKGGSRLILDDPNDPTAKPSEQVEALRFFSDKLQSRLNDPSNPSIIVQQRTAENDITGFILANKRPEHPFTHLSFPAEFEIEQANPFDWRQIEGEVLWPEQYPTEMLRKLQRFMDPTTIAGQYQQRPQSKTGGSFDISKMEIVDTIEDGCVFCRAWDFASTEEGGDWTVGALLALGPSGTVYIVDIMRGQWRSDEVESVVKLIADQDGVSCPVSIPQDPGQAGAAQVLYYITKVLPQFDVRVRRPTGAKTVRAQPLASQCRAGNVKLVRGAWNKDYTHEAHLFPKSEFDDQVDASSDAYNEITANGGGFVPTMTKKDILKLPRRVLTHGLIIESPEPTNRGLIGMLPRRRG
jgi:predicted phage terminase large subunit-like protein